MHFFKLTEWLSLQEKNSPEVLSQLFHKYNSELFGGELLDTIPISFGKTSKGAAGQTMCKGNALFVKKETIQIVISDLYDWKDDPELLKGVVVHEMIHAYFMLHDRGKENHGPYFQAKVRELSSKAGFEIPLTDSFRKDYNPDNVKTAAKEMCGVIGEFRDGRYGLALCGPALFARVRDNVEGTFSSGWSKLKKVWLVKLRTQLHNELPIGKSRLQFGVLGQAGVPTFEELMGTATVFKEYEVPEKATTSPSSAPVGKSDLAKVFADARKTNPDLDRQLAALAADRKNWKRKRRG